MKKQDVAPRILEGIDMEAFLEYIDPDWRTRGFPDAAYGFCWYIEYLSPYAFHRVLRESQ